MLKLINVYFILLRATGGVGNQWCGGAFSGCGADGSVASALLNRCGFRTAQKAQSPVAHSGACQWDHADVTLLEYFSA